MIPCLSVYAENASSIMSAKAGSTSIENTDIPFISIDDKTNDITFNESKINVTIEKIEPFTISTISGTAKDVKHNTSNNVISVSFSGSKYVERISFEIKAANTSVDELKKAYMGFNSSRTIKGEIYKGGFPRSVSECIKTGENTYILHFDGLDQGETYNFQIQGLDNINGLEVKSYTVCSKSTYYKVEATCDGDGICAFLPESEGLNEVNMAKWAKNQCLLANSMNHITNQNNEIIYYYFNCPAGMASSQSFSWTNSNDGSLICVGRIQFNPDATDKELELIKSESNCFNFFTMHEMGHLYGNLSKFETEFVFNSYRNDETYSNDEYYTNVRALTALQNCSNFKDYDYKVRNTDEPDPNNIYSYDEVYYDKRAGNDYNFNIARCFIKVCGWEKLETFYKAEKAPDYASKETIDAANKLVDRLGITIEGYNSNGEKKESILKFVNMLRWLYKVSTGLDYNEGDDDFINFIDQTFTVKVTDVKELDYDVTGLDYITKMLVHENICSPIILKEKPTNVQAKVGEQAKTKVSAIGEGLTYEWWYCEPGTDVFYKSPRITGYTYDCTMTEAKNGRKIYCVITDKYNNSIQTDTVTIGLPLELKTDLDDVWVEMGEKLKTSIEATGCGLTYTWYYKNKEMSDFKVTNSFKGDTYDFDEMTEERDGRQIYCVISDIFGNSVTTKTVTLGVPVKITKDLVDVTAKLGEKVEFSVSAKGHGLTYKWYFKNKDMKNFEVTETFKTNKYGFEEMTEKRAGREVYCEITDIFGKTAKTETIKINLLGDANCDGMLTAADYAAIIQALANPQKYDLSVRGKINADVSGENGVTAYDAQLIRAYDAELISSFPASEK